MLNSNEFQLFEETKACNILNKGYTGAYLGIYGTSHGTKSNDFADFVWINYKGFEKF